jgi:neutral ceramidase
MTMKINTIHGIFLAVSFIISSYPLYGIQQGGWKAGVAKTEITPAEPLKMSGYAGRTELCKEKLHPLWAKALALEDAAGNRSVLVTMDLALLPRAIADDIKARINKQYNLDRSHVLLSWSHTHTGPVISDDIFYDFLGIEASDRVKIDRYSKQTEDQIVNAVGKALNSLSPVKVFSGIGVARFAVNRRNNNEAALTPLTPLAGPVDHSVPVISVTKTNGEIMAIVFGYACHSTTLNGYQWSGDYPGFAQAELEEIFPGSVAMFFAGAGADQNPLPRRTVALARQHGKTLAAAVEAVASDPMQELDPVMKTGYREVYLPFTTLPSREELVKAKESSNIYKKKWATRLLANLDRDKKFPAGYPAYPLQIWKLGNQNLVALGGEVVVDYSLRLKQIIGPDLFVMSYANDEVFYIPSTRVLREGGYEGTDVLIYTNRPATWSAEIENIILGGVIDLAKETGVKIAESKLSVK